MSTHTQTHADKAKEKWWHCRRAKIAEHIFHGVSTQSDLSAHSERKKNTTRSKKNWQIVCASRAMHTERSVRNMCSAAECESVNRCLAFFVLHRLLSLSRSLFCPDSVVVVALFFDDFFFHLLSSSFFAPLVVRVLMPCRWVPEPIANGLAYSHIARVSAIVDIVLLIAAQTFFI